MIPEWKYDFIQRLIFLFCLQKVMNVLIGGREERNNHAHPFVHLYDKVLLLQ